MENNVPMNTGKNTVNYRRVPERRLLQVIIAVLAMLTCSESTAADKPSYVSLDSFAPPSYTRISYDWHRFLSPVDGKTRLTLHGPGNTLIGHYLFDVEAREVVGELKNGTPVFFDPVGGRIVCTTRGPAVSSLEKKLDAIASKAQSIVDLDKSQWQHDIAVRKSFHEDLYWIVEMKSNRASSIGSILEYDFKERPGDFIPSPSHTHAVNAAWSGASGEHVYTINLDKQAMGTIGTDVTAFAWWDEQQILAADKNTRDLLLVNPDTQNRSILLPASQVADFLGRNDLDGLPGFPIPVWDGHRFQFFMRITRKIGEAKEFDLLKLLPNCNLEIAYRSFEPRRRGCFDQAMRHYVFSCQIPNQEDDGVYIRNLETGEEKTLIPSTGSGEFSAPSFHGDRVIYVRDKTLWSISTDGTDQKRLFPK